MTLIFDIRLDHLISDIATATEKIAARPHLPTPLALPDGLKFPQQHVRTRYWFSLITLQLADF
jgi:hypothetical protein